MEVKNWRCFIESLRKRDVTEADLACATSAAEDRSGVAGAKAETLDFNCAWALGIGGFAWDAVEFEEVIGSSPSGEDQENGRDGTNEKSKLHKRVFGINCAGRARLMCYPFQTNKSPGIEGYGCC